MNNNRGVSAIVTTVILLALALIAVGVVWAVISNILTERGDAAQTTSSCIDASIEIPLAEYNSTEDNKNLTVKIKNVGSKDIPGVRVVAGSLIDDANITSLTPLATKTVVFTRVAAKPAEEVIAAAYFGTTENPTICQGEKTKTITVFAE